MKFLSRPSPLSILVFALGLGAAVGGSLIYGFGKHVSPGQDIALMQLQQQRAGLNAYSDGVLNSKKQEQSSLDARLWHKADFDHWSSNVFSGDLVVTLMKDAAENDTNSASYILRLDQLGLDNFGKLMSALGVITSHAGTRVLTIDMLTTPGDPSPTRFDHALITFSVVFPHGQ